MAFGTDLKEICDHILPKRGSKWDDKLIRASNIAHVRAITGLKTKDLGLAITILQNLWQERSLKEYLLTKDGMPRYRFCSECLREPGGDYMRIHWRFKAWQWCPFHEMQMSSECFSCGAAVVLPAHMIRRGKENTGAYTLRQCLSCGVHLTSLEGVLRPSAVLTPVERMWTLNARALLSALCVGHYRMPNSQARFPLRKLSRLGSLIPNRDIEWGETMEQETHPDAAQVQPPAALECAAPSAPRGI